MGNFDAEIKSVIPSVFNLIGSCSDDQESNESYNVKKFGLPNPAGKSGSACTSVFLKLLYEKKSSMTWWDMMDGIQSNLITAGFDNQSPTFSSSRKIDLQKQPFQIVPPGSSKRRAVLIGINYLGTPEQLRSCQNDCLNIKNYLVEVEGFNESEMMILMDDGKHTPPTKENIQNAFITLAQYSRSGDVNFISFSGHGGQTKDMDGDEEGGMDSTLIPVDAKKEGMIVDDDILRMLVKPMPAGVTTTVIVDCCHSGSVLDLPYEMKGKRLVGQTNYNMEIVKKAIKPLTKAQLVEKKKREKQARKEARAAERQRRKEEEAKRQSATGQNTQVASDADIEACKQQFLRQAQANMKNKSNGGRVVLGPVQVVTGMAPTKQKFGSTSMGGPQVMTYQMPVASKVPPTPKIRQATSSQKPVTYKTTRASGSASPQKAKKLGSLISKFEK